MFKPKYTITDELLSNIKRIGELAVSLNNRRFPQVVLVDLERQARVLSAFASTSIEGNPLPLTEVKKILKAQPKYIRDSEKEVLNYNKALENLNNKLQKDNKAPLTIKLILDIHKQVVQGLLANFQVGKWRKEPVQVLDPRSNQPVFLPPDWKVVPELMDELVGFVNENNKRIDPLILAGIFHKQFVIIHPFMDGNGRTARLITKVLLAGMGLDTFNLFSFENYYNQNVTRYIRKVGEQGDYNELTAEEKIEFTKWLEYFTEGIINELLRVEKLLPKYARSPKVQLKAHHELILEYLKDNLFITNNDYVNLVDRAKATRILDFNFMIEQGYLERKGKGKNTYYVLKGGEE
jgi:Fic family protein